jgi:uncharacterized membrane protein HdeD (DUF308 family)
MGCVTAALGLFLVVYPLATGVVTTVLVGWALIFVGIAQFVFALHSQTAGRFFLKALSSLLYAICGVALALFPPAGLAALTAILGSLLLVQAALVTAVAFQMRPLKGWGWLLVDAAASLALGILIFAEWPSSSVWAIGTLVGVSVFVGGIARITIAAKVRSGAATLHNLVQDTA